MGSFRLMNIQNTTRGAPCELGKEPRRVMDLLDRAELALRLTMSEVIGSRLGETGSAKLQELLICLRLTSSEKKNVMTPLKQNFFFSAKAPHDFLI